MRFHFLTEMLFFHFVCNLVMYHITFGETTLPVEHEGFDIYRKVMSKLIVVPHW